MRINETAADAVAKPVTYGVAMVIIIAFMGTALAVTGATALNLMIEKQNDLWTAQRKMNADFNEGLREMVRAISSLADKQVSVDQKTAIANIRLDNHDRSLQRLEGVGR